MSGITDTATVTLNVNGAQAKQMMSELEQKISDTKQCQIMQVNNSKQKRRVPFLSRLKLKNVCKLLTYRRLTFDQSG